MSELLISISLLVGSFFLLIKSADYLISSSTVLGERGGISKFVIGLTVVAIGTSLPELFTSIFGIMGGEGAAFVLGTVIGSNISNILLVFGILLLFSKTFKVKIGLRDVIFLALSAGVVITGVFLGEFSFLFSTILLFFFLVYIYISVISGKKEDFEEEAKEAEDGIIKWTTRAVSFLFLGSLIGLNLAANGVVYSIQELGRILSIPLEYLTLTTVAFATSLPEIVVTYTAAKKEEYSLGVGNIIGSNISNILFIIGFSGIFSATFSESLIFKTEMFLTSALMMLGITFIFIGLLVKAKIPKYYSYILFLLYGIYIYMLFT